MHEHGAGYHALYHEGPAQHCCRYASGDPQSDQGNEGGRSYSVIARFRGDDATRIALTKIFLVLGRPAGLAIADESSRGCPDARQRAKKRTKKRRTQQILPAEA